MVAARNSAIALVLLVLLAPLTGLFPILLMKVLCFALFACAFNLLLGFAGLMSFGHAMFFGAAGYVSAHAMKVWGFPPEAGLLLGVVVGALLGAMTGLLAIRRQGIYFAMISLAFAQMVFFTLLQSPFTGGENGLQAIPRGHLFGVLSLENDRVLYYLVAAVFLLGWFAIRRFVHSPFGQVLKAIRENEARAISLGYDTKRVKLLAFVLSAGLSGLAGATKGLVVGVVTLGDAHWHTSGDVVLMTLVGGMGTLIGPAIGAAFIVFLQSWLADRLGAWVTSIMGMVFIVCVLAFRGGIAGEVSRVAQRLRERRARRSVNADSAATAAND